MIFRLKQLAVYFLGENPSLWGIVGNSVFRNSLTTSGRQCFRWISPLYPPPQCTHPTLMLSLPPACSSTRPLSRYYILGTSCLVFGTFWYLIFGTNMDGLDNFIDSYSWFLILTIVKLLMILTILTNISTFPQLLRLFPVPSLRTQQSLGDDKQVVIIVRITTIITTISTITIILVIITISTITIIIVIRITTPVNIIIVVMIITTILNIIITIIVFVIIRMIIIYQETRHHPCSRPSELLARNRRQLHHHSTGLLSVSLSLSVDFSPVCVFK